MTTSSTGLARRALTDSSVHDVACQLADRHDRLAFQSSYPVAV